MRLATTDNDIPHLTPRLSRRRFLRQSAVIGLSIPVLTGLLAACGGDDDEPAAITPSSTASAGAATSTSVAPPTAAASGGTFIEGSGADATTLNPILISDTASATVADLLFNSLIRLDPETTEPLGELAESWQVSDDDLEFTFVLRSDVLWHDGTPLTANDVKFTYDLHMNEAGSSVRTSTLAQHITSIDVVNDTEITFTLNGVVASFLALDMVQHIVPRHILEDVPVDLAELGSHGFSTGEKGVTIGSGPFMFEEWVRDDHITLAKNAAYWAGAPELDQYIFRVVGDPNVLAQQMKTGELDYSGRDGIAESAYEELSQVDGLEVVAFDTFDFTYYAYQLDPAKSTLFQDPAVRQALLYALDRQSMVDVIRFGLGEVAVGTMGVLSWAYDPASIEHTYAFDQEKAKSLLDEAGWVAGAGGVREKDGERLAFTMHTNAESAVNSQYLEVMQQAWAEIGVEATPEVEEFGIFISRIAETKDFDLFLTGFAWESDPDQSGMWATEAYNGGFNVNMYSNPDVDRLLSDGLSTTDLDERKRIYTEMQNIVLNDLPSAILDFPKAIAAVDTKVRNVHPSVVDDRYNAYLWGFKP